jgi:hypothetical protein
MMYLMKQSVFFFLDWEKYAEVSEVSVSDDGAVKFLRNVGKF